MMNIHRFRRHLIDFFSTHSVNTHSVSGSNNQINMPSANTQLTKMNNSPGESGRQFVSEIMGTGTELVRAPVTWINHMRSNWLVYLICSAIICLTLVYFYCIISQCLNRKRNSQNDLLTLATMIESRQKKISYSTQSERSCE